MTDPKPFQKATVEAACKTLADSTKQKPRFLVADEVGLGKTVVAQQVIEKLSRGRDRPLTVYYVCSSLTIASQNKTKLLEAAVAEGDSGKALCSADRLSMLPFESRPTHERVHLYTLTPDTSLPIRKGKRRDGRKDERALIYCLLDSCWPGVIDAEALRGQVVRHWDQAIDSARNALEKLRSEDEANFSRLKDLFRLQVLKQPDLIKGRDIDDAIRGCLDAGPGGKLTLIGALRAALVECTLELEGLRPDLVIFDEFQRFRDLVRPSTSLNGEASSENAHALIQQLRGDASHRVALLLLSATPYSLYSRRDEEELFGGHHEQLLELLCFLYGDGEEGLAQAKEAAELFREFGSLIQSAQLDEAAFGRIDRIRHLIEHSLASVMSRTERARIDGQLSTGDVQKRPEPIEVSVDRSDWKVFRHISERFPGHYRGASVAYWRSIPLPMQTMGAGYRPWRDANEHGHKPSLPAPSFLEKDWGQSKKYSWPHPKLRELIDEVRPETLCLPWVAPSMPWWKLGQGWANEEAQRGKLLLFSRFRATPKSVAAALSHEARSAASRLGNLRDKGSQLPLIGRRMPVVAMFFPSLWLATICDPIEATGKRPQDARRHVRRQIKEWLIGQGIPVRKDYRRKTWELLAALDARFLNSSDAAGLKHPQDMANIRLPGPDDVAANWAEAAKQQISEISEPEVNSLAELALGAPGAVLARSIARHYRDRGDELANSYEQLLEVSLNSWRNYFDNSVFVASLRRRKRSYPKALRQAVVDGNLEAVLDEHIWYQNQGGGAGLESVLEDLMTALGVRGGRVPMHDPNSRHVLFNAQCDAALPLSQELEPVAPKGGKAAPLRTDQVRTAFNSPFWPFVLTTTSVGQEGLDFHPWCQTLIHWDLPGNPVDLEQREGRIQRYAGLAVRRCMADDHQNELLGSLQKGESPWQSIERLVNDKTDGTGSGLEPWWSYPGASVRSMFFHMPASEEELHLIELKKQRSIYRLALGQQHQEDFVRMVSSKDTNTLQKLAERTPNLSAWKSS